LSRDDLAVTRRVFLKEGLLALAGSPPCFLVGSLLGLRESTSHRPSLGIRRVLAKNTLDALTFGRS